MNNADSQQTNKAIINAKLLYASENVLFILIHVLENVKYTPFTIRLESLTAVYSNSVSIRDLVASTLSQNTVWLPVGCYPNSGNIRNFNWKVVKSAPEFEVTALSKMSRKTVCVIFGDTPQWLLWWANTVCIIFGKILQCSAMYRLYRLFPGL